MRSAKVGADGNVKLALAILSGSTRRAERMSSYRVVVMNDCHSTYVEKFHVSVVASASIRSPHDAMLPPSLCKRSRGLRVPLRTTLRDDAEGCPLDQRPLTALHDKLVATVRKNSASAADFRKVRIALFQLPKMLRDARMVAKRKLRRGVGATDEAASSLGRSRHSSFRWARENGAVHLGQNGLTADIGGDTAFP